ASHSLLGLGISGTEHRAPRLRPGRKTEAPGSSGLEALVLLRRNGGITALDYLLRRNYRQMLIGAMNHPARDVVSEIRWMADMGLDFVDLTFEPPAAASWRVKPDEIRLELERHKMKVVGHTAYYLPIASAFEEVRRAAVQELCRCLDLF